MNKTKTYSIIFALLLAIVAFTFYNKYSKEKKDNQFKTFKVKDFSKVTMLKFSDKLGRKMLLKKVDNAWILNNKYPVRTHLFKEMSEALTKMKAFHTVSLAGQENAINNILQQGIKVEIYEGKNKPTKTIHIGGPNHTSTASYMILEIDGKTSPMVYEVGIPGFRGYLTGRFLIDENEWRSKEIFTYLPSDIKQIKIDYNNNNNNKSFILTKEGENYSLEFNDKKITHEKLNQKAIVNLLLTFEKQNVLTFEFEKQEEQAKKDSLYKINKFAEVKILDINNNTKELSIIEMPLRHNSKQIYDKQGYELAYDPDFKFIVNKRTKYWGVIANDNFGEMFIDPNNLVNAFAK